MTILLMEAQGTMKKLQSLFHQVFDDYVDVIEIKQLDERESADVVPYCRLSMFGSKQALYVLQTIVKADKAYEANDFSNR